MNVDRLFEVADDTTDQRPVVLPRVLREPCCETDSVGYVRTNRRDPVEVSNNLEVLETVDCGLRRRAVLDALLYGQVQSFCSLEA